MQGQRGTNGRRRMLPRRRLSRLRRPGADQERGNAARALVQNPTDMKGTEDGARRVLWITKKQNECDILQQKHAATIEL